MFLKTWPAARPSLRAVSAVTGSMLARPRTPSVPKIFLGAVIIEPCGLDRFGKSFGDGNAFEIGEGGLDLFDANVGRRPDLYLLANLLFVLNRGRVNKGLDLINLEFFEVVGVSADVHAHQGRVDPKLIGIARRSQESDRNGRKFAVAGSDHLGLLAVLAEGRVNGDPGQRGEE